MNNILFFIFFIFFFVVILSFFSSFKKYENFSSGKIPLIMYKTGPENNPSEKILELFKKNEDKLNVKIIYFNDQDCINFMSRMGGKYFRAYNSLIPTAYKADLWRYCVLYKNGGVYGDLTQNFLKNYDINKGGIDMVFVKDINRKDIQISFMATSKNNGFFKYLIENISNDILKKKMGKGCLDITGPKACGRHFKIFFNIDDIPYGINSLKGLDNKYYKVKIDIQQYPGTFYNINEKGKLAITKTKWHQNLITNKGKNPKYWTLYSQNRVFK